MKYHICTINVRGTGSIDFILEWLHLRVFYSIVVWRLGVDHLLSFIRIYFIDFDQKVINQYFSLKASIDMRHSITDITIFYRNRYTIKIFILITFTNLAIPFYSVLVWDFLSSTHHASTFYQAFVSIFTLLYSTHGPTHILSHTLIYLIAYLLCRRMIEN